MARGKERKNQDSIALERIEVLFGLAAGAQDQLKACDLVSLANRISLRCRTPIPQKYRLTFCRKCLSYFTAENSRTRLNPGHRRVETKCLKCGYIRVKPYRKDRTKTPKDKVPTQKLKK